MLRHPIIPSFLSLAIAIAVTDGLDLGRGGVAACLLVALVMLALALARRRGVALASLACVGMAGAWSSAQGRQILPLVIPCEGAEGDGSGLWQVEVVGPVVRRRQPQAGQVSRQTRVRLLAKRCANQWRPARGRVRATFPDTGHHTTALARGDFLQLNLRVRAVESSRNPTGPDPRSRARRDGISGWAMALSPPVTTERRGGFWALLDRLRHRAALTLEDTLGPPLAGFGKALTLGDGASVSAAARERWAAAGMAHLLAISGLHVGMLAALFYFIIYHGLAFLPGAAERFSVRRYAALATVPLLALFCVWVGAPASATRATLMASAFLCGLAFGRLSTAANALGVAGTILLLSSPAALYDPSFLLSFAAVAGLLLLLPSQPMALSWWQRVWRYFRGALLASLAATVATAPISAYYFGRVSLVAPLTNLVAVPLGTLLATPLALLFVVAAPIAASIQSALGWLLGKTLGLLDGLAHIVEASGVAAVDVPRPTAVETVAYFVLVLSALAAKRRRHLWAAVALAALTLGGAVGWRLHKRFGSEELAVIHPYVGQGDASIVLLPGGGTMVVDAGGAADPDGWDPGRHVMAPLLRQLGIRSIDLAVVTHPHPDHFRGFEYLAGAFPIGELWWNGVETPAGDRPALVARVAAQGGVVRVLRDVPAAQNRFGLRIEALHPRPKLGHEGLPYYPELNDNDNSVVLRLRYRQRSLLLTGDIERAAEAMLAPQLTPTEVVKVPHHGSPTSSTQALVAATGPKWAVISCGDRNYFGFPHPEVLKRYQKTGARILRTDQDGLIELRTDGTQWQVRTHRGGWLRP